MKDSIEVTYRGGPMHGKMERVAKADYIFFDEYQQNERTNPVEYRAIRHTYEVHRLGQWFFAIHAGEEQ